MFALIGDSVLMMGILFTSFYVFAKSIQYTPSKGNKALAVVWCLIWAVLFAFVARSAIIPLALFRPLVGIFSIAFIVLISRKELNEQRKYEKYQMLETVVSAFLLSFGVGYFLHYLSLVPFSIGITFLFIGEYAVDAPIDFNHPIYVLMYGLTAILQVTLAVLFFRIRRFRNGFRFIFNKYTIVASLIFTGIILSFVTWISMLADLESDATNNAMTRALYITGVLIAGIGIYILIRRLIEMWRKNKVQENNAAHYQKLYEEYKGKYEREAELNAKLSTKTHNFTDRLKSMEAAVERGDATLEDVKRLRAEWQDELAEIKAEKPLTSTNIRTIDNLFKQYAKQFDEDGIDFALSVSGSVVYMVENIIKQGKLETLIVNHLNDAQIAINKVDDSFRSIAAIIGINDNHYELTVFDGGIPFEVDTLQRLGTGRVTTHADTGGSGIGFETTFATMKEVGASLIINEKAPGGVGHTKSVTIRFDGKGQYIIKTYRPNAFSASDRYIVTER